MDELGIGARHLTISTVGLAPQIRRRSPEIARDCIGSWSGEPLPPSAAPTNLPQGLDKTTPPHAGCTAVLRESLGNQPELTTPTVIWARQLVSPHSISFLPSSISRRFAEEGLEVGLAILEAAHLSPYLPISHRISPYLGP